MIRIFSIISFFILTSSAILNPVATIEWQATTIDFGEVIFKKPVTAEFNFRNPGLIPLIINDVKSSCGCTIADFPRKPIVSGQEGKILITFDAETEGQFNKTIRVYTNAEEAVTQLFIKGVVIK